MEIKQIKLSPKRGGNGFISSFSINIGSKEASECGLFDPEGSVLTIKIVDSQNGRIIIKRKQYTLTNDILSRVFLYATKSREYSESILASGSYYSEANQSTVIAARVHDDTYFEYLLSLDAEVLTDLMTLLCMGRDADVNMSLPPRERFFDYWQYLAQVGCFTLGTEELASQILYNVSLVDYLKKGLAMIGESPYIT